MRCSLRITHTSKALGDAATAAEVSTAGVVVVCGLWLLLVLLLILLPLILLLLLLLLLLFMWMFCEADGYATVGFDFDDLENITVGVDLLFALAIAAALDFTDVAPTVEFVL